MSVTGGSVSGQELCVAGFLGARLTREDFDERRVALHEELEGGLHAVEILEVVHALGAGAEFAGGLRAAQEQDAEDGDFVSMEIESFVEAVLVFGDAIVAAGGAGESLIAERAQGVADGIFIETHDGFAIGFLVAGVEERVEGQWIVFGSGDFFFDEGAEDAGFDVVEEDVHGEILARVT